MNLTLPSPSPSSPSGSDAHPRSSRYDVVVVGARVAGAATALLLARRGLSVLAVDRGGYGTDVVSTHSVSPAGVLQLSRWGVLDRIRAAGTPPTRTVHFDYGGQVVELDVKQRGDVDGVYNPRRTVLDPALVDAAVEAGAEVCFGVTVVELSRDATGRVDGVVVRDGQRLRRIAASIVVGADGARSRVAREVRAAMLRTEDVAMGTVYAYFDGLPDDRIANFFRDGRVVGTIPTNDGATLVWVGLPAHRFSDEVAGDTVGAHSRYVDSIPEARDALGGAQRVSGFRSFSGSPGVLRQAWGPGWVLAGDAAYFKDPISAHGITDALIGAELVAVSIAAALGEGDEGGVFTHMQDLRDAMATEMMPHVAAAAALPADSSVMIDAWIGMAGAMRSEWALIESEFGVLTPV